MRGGTGPTFPSQPCQVVDSSGRFLTIDLICVALNFRWQPQVMRDVVLVPPLLLSATGCLNPAEHF